MPLALSSEGHISFDLRFIGDWHDFSVVDEIGHRRRVQHRGREAGTKNVYQLEPRIVNLDTESGHSPQHLLTELRNALAS